MLRDFINGLREIIYPKVCLACKKKLPEASIDNIVCRECWTKIKRNMPPFCFRCGRHLEAKHAVKNICRSCLKTSLHFDRAFSACQYDGALKELLHEFKYKNKEHLGATLSKLMIEFIKEYNLPMDYLDFVLPIPLHKTKLREREFNQAQIFSRHIAEAFKKSTSDKILLRHRNTKTQTELGDQQRFLNVKNSFCVTAKEDIKNKNILLVDDVFTTGATASWAAHALKDSGANIVFVLTLAN